MKTAAEVKDIEQKLKENGVKYCIGAYVDIHGIPKGKVVPIDHLYGLCSRWLRARAKR